MTFNEAIKWLKEKLMNKDFERAFKSISTNMGKIRNTQWFT